MPGAKIPVLEIEKLRLTDDGRGVELYNDGTNFLKGRIWSGRAASGNKEKLNTADAGYPNFLCAASSSGWLKLHMVSSSTYGATGATYYVPVFSAVDTRSSV